MKTLTDQEQIIIINVDNEFARISQKYGIEIIEGKAKEHFFEEWHLKME